MTTITVTGSSNDTNLIVDSASSTISDGTAVGTVATAAEGFIAQFDSTSNTGLKSLEVTIIESFICDTSANAQEFCSIAGPAANVPMVTGNALRYELFHADNVCQCVRTFANLTHLNNALEATAGWEGTEMDYRANMFRDIQTDIQVQESDVAATRTKYWATAGMQMIARGKNPILNVYGFSGGYRLQTSNPPLFDPSGALGSLYDASNITVIEAFTCATNTDAKAYCAFSEIDAMAVAGTAGSPVRYELSVQDNVCYCYRLFTDPLHIYGQWTVMGLMTDAAFNAMAGANMALLLRVHYNVYAGSASIAATAKTNLDAFLAARSQFTNPSYSINSPNIILASGDTAMAGLGGGPMGTIQTYY